MSNLVASPCCLPEWRAPELLEAYSRMGFTAYEVFTEWAKARFDWTRPPETYLAWGSQYNLAYTSLHLPLIEDDSDAPLQRAIDATHFAKALGVEVVLFKAASRELYINMAKPFLNAIDRLGVTPVLQNHAGSALSTLDDFKYILAGIADSRMKTLLEVGQFHSVGQPWREAAEFLGDSVALVHIKDQEGPVSVPFGTGEIDIPALFEYMNQKGFTGRYVVEMEAKDSENTLNYLEDALNYLETHCTGAKR